MLEWIRVKIKGIVIWIITGIITIVFFLGTADYLFNKNKNNNIIAAVNGQPIYTDTVDLIYAEHIRTQHASRKNYSTLDLDPQKIKNQITLDLINQKAITTELQNAGFTVDDKQIIQIIKSIPYFQENNKFSVEKYTNFFKQSNFSETDYSNSLKASLLQEQFQNSILLSSFVSDTDVNNLVTAQQQSRDFGYVIMPFDQFIKQNNTDLNKKLNQDLITQESTDYYNNNKFMFVTPETAKIAYLDLSKDQMLKNISVTKDELFKYYQEHISYYTLPELVNIKHILNKSKPIIEEVLAKLKAGQKFAELAKQFSEDSTTSNNGGDLGWTGKGETELDFEKAAFALKKPGEFSDIVQTSFGYHIIQLNSKREAKVKPYEEILAQITNDYKEDLLQTKFHNVIEELENGSFENEDLLSLANKFNLDLKFIGPFTSHGETTGILSYNEVVIAAFDRKHLNKNSNLIKLTNDRFVILKTTELNEKTQKTYAESYADIQQILQNIKAKQEITKQGLILAKELLNTKNSSKLVKTYGKFNGLNLEWILVDQATRNSKNLNPEILKAVFSLSKTNTQTAFTLKNNNFIIIKLLNINNNLNNNLNTLLNTTREQLIALEAKLEQSLYENDLIKTAKIKFFNQQDQNK